MPTSREIAFDILLQVQKGAFADDLLRGMRGETQQDLNLANELVYGVLRHQLRLDFLIAHYAGNTKKLDIEVRTALQLGVYQIRHLDRIPAHAAVATSVDLVKRARKRSAAGFVNAVLRKANRDAVVFPSKEVELSVPSWLFARWRAHHGDAESIARQALEKPEAHTRNGRFMDVGAQAIVPLLAPAVAKGLRVVLEPGRSIVGPAGALVTRVLYRKLTATKEFVVVDAAMNDLIRPALYQAHHEILPLRQNGAPPTPLPWAAVGGL